MGPPGMVVVDRRAATAASTSLVARTPPGVRAETQGSPSPGSPGYEGASIHQIAGRAGVVVPVFYDHFSGRDAVTARAGGNIPAGTSTVAGLASRRRRGQTDRSSCRRCLRGLPGHRGAAPSRLRARLPLDASSGGGCARTGTPRSGRRNSQGTAGRSCPHRRA
ncbi:MAG: TetR family transcriptional regulator [Thermoleophilaceae bacterium]